MGAASELAAAVAEGRRSAVDVAQAALAAIAAYEAVQPQVWISRTPAEAVLARAREVDARVEAGESLPLAGVPYAVKDNIDAAALPTTAACPAFAYQPDKDAEVVARLHDLLIAQAALRVGHDRRQLRPQPLGLLELGLGALVGDGGIGGAVGRDGGAHDIHRMRVQGQQVDRILRDARECAVRALEAL